jgi:hypothetical protein
MLLTRNSGCKITTFYPLGDDMGDVFTPVLTIIKNIPP